MSGTNDVSRRRRRAASIVATGATLLVTLAPAGSASAIGTATKTAATAAITTAATTTAATTARSATPGAATLSLVCRTAWGTGAKGPRIVAMETAPITGVRAGRHTCFDRVVIDVGGDVARSGVSARYVSEVLQDGTGDVIPLRGAAKLRVTVGNVVYDRDGRIVYDPKNDAELVSTRGFSTLRQVALAGSFEGTSSFGVGVAQKRPYRLFVLDGASGDRVVLDIAHR